ncbi:MAG: hypothetical protein U9N45_08340, partial [Gemmatimonadota bacterium]|nr:hypothetical protein [Gemmatimonadota bacterium]
MYPNCRSQRLNSWRSNAIHPFTGIFCSLVLMFFLSALISGPLVAAEPEGNTILECGAFSTLEEASAQGWEQLSQRDEIRPEFFVSRKLSLPGGKGSLGIYGASSSLNRGCWSRLVDGIKEGCFYRFEAFYFARGVDCPHLKAFARLRWSSPEGDKPGWRDYVPELGKKGEWRKVGGVFRAPKGVDRVRVELFLSHSPQGTALWDEIRLAEVPALPKRPVRLATANCRPSDNSSSAESVEEFCRVVEQAGEQGCDIICLGEG